MPNETLIGALERLRDSYSQRQRAAAGLQTALKGATGALSKAGRTLREFAEQNSGLSSSGLAQSQQAFGALRLKEEAVDPLMPDLRRELKLLASLTAGLKEALAALRGEITDVV